MENTLGLNQGALAQARLEPFLDACGRVGIREVELRVPKIIEALYHLPPDQLQKLLRKNEIQVTAVNSLDDFALVPDQNLGILEREAQTAADLCKAVGCDLVVAVAGRWFEEEPPDPKWVRKRSADRLRRVSDILGPEGIRVGVEPIAFPYFTVWSLEEAMEIIEASGVSNAMLVADVYNLMQGESTSESMRRFGEKIAMIHVNDAAHRRYEEMDVMYTRAFPGEGVLDPAEWVAAAVDGGFSGAVSMEIFDQEVWKMEIDRAAQLCAIKMAEFVRS